MSASSSPTTTAATACPRRCGPSPAKPFPTGRSSSSTTARPQARMNWSKRPSQPAAGALYATIKIAAPPRREIPGCETPPASSWPSSIPTTYGCRKNSKRKDRFSTASPNPPPGILCGANPCRHGRRLDTQSAGARRGRRRGFFRVPLCRQRLCASESFLLSRERALETPFAEQLRQYEDHLFFLMAGWRGAKYRLVGEPLVVWNNDTRGDRASRADNLEQGSLSFIWRRPA